jgi:hypothetical protein
MDTFETKIADVIKAIMICYFDRFRKINFEGTILGKLVVWPVAQ